MSKGVRYLSERELSLLRSTARKGRDFAILEVLYETGCLVKELVELQKKIAQAQKKEGLAEVPANVPERVKRLVTENLKTNCFDLIVKFTQDAERIEALIDAHGVGALIFGLPVSMDGTEGPRCQSTRQFAANLLERRDIPIAFWDERLSTAAIQRMLISEHDMTRKRRSEVVDKAAAAYILQGAMDAIRARARDASGA